MPLDYISGKYRGIDALVRAVAEHLSAVGIRVLPRPQPLDSFVAHLVQRDTPFFLAGILSDTGDAGPSYEYLLHTPEHGLGWLNAGGYSSPRLDGLLDAASQLFHSEARGELLASAAAQVEADVPVVPLVVPDDLYAFRRNLGFQPRPVRRIRAAEIRWQRERIVVSRAELPGAPGP